jgi:flagellar hook-associated protein 1 FlgK
MNQLDTLAFDVASSLNTAHAAGAGLDGVSGRAMFVAPTQVAGAAASLEIDPGLDADADQLATGTPGAGAGDNRGALALFAISTAAASSTGGTLSGAALGLVSSVGRQTADANASAAREGLVSEHLAGLRDSLAGVDIQEELTNLSKFEHASSAMTRFVSTIDGLLGDLIDRL